MGEYLGIISKCLELHRIPRGIEEEHRPLLAYFALETDIRLDHEVDLASFQAIGKFVELRYPQNHAKVRHRYVMPVNRVRRRCIRALYEMGDDLVTVEIPVHPCRIGATHRTSEQLSVKVPSRVEIIDWDSEMETRMRRQLISFNWLVQPEKGRDQ